MKRHMIRTSIAALACVGFLNCSHSEEAAPAEELEAPTEEMAAETAEGEAIEAPADEMAAKEAVKDAAAEVDAVEEQMPEGLSWWQRLEYRISKAGEKNSEEAERRVRGQLEEWGWIDSPSNEAIADDSEEVPVEETH